MIDRRVEDALRQWGLSCTYQGYFCLIHAMHLAETMPAHLEMVPKLLYPDLAKQCGLSISAVDSAIRTSIRVCCRHNGARVAQYCGTDGTPTVSQFINGLFRYIHLSGGGSF